MIIDIVPDLQAFFREIAGLLRPGGRILIVESPFHVSRKDFKQMIAKAAAAGLVVEKGPKMLYNKQVGLEKRDTQKSQ
jgi:23S rRNA G2069 N7-methylase RlmK/C1962 C5-methylase RlmI